MNTSTLLQRYSGLFLALFITSASAAFASDEKTITVHPDSAQATLEFTFEPTQPSFDINEALQFTLQANQDIFLYVYTVTQSGEYALILPNNMQTENKYPAATPMQVPNRNVAFMADGSVAVEPVYAIASTRYIDLELAKQPKSGDFPLVQADDMKKRFGEKGIVLRELDAGETQVQVVTSAANSEVAVAASTTTDTSADTGSTSSTGTGTGTGSNSVPTEVVGEASMVRVDVAIDNIQPATQAEPTPAPAAQPATTEPVIAFVATDRADYNNGDRVHILFGASQAGSVALYLIDPDGTGGEQPIITREVDGNNFIKVSATHDGSTGEHVIRAVYLAPDSNSKSLRLDEQAPSTVGQSVTINVAK